MKLVGAVALFAPVSFVTPAVLVFVWGSLMENLTGLFTALCNFSHMQLARFWKVIGYEGLR